MGALGLFRNMKKMNKTTRGMDLTQHAAAKTTDPPKSSYCTTCRVYEKTTFSYFSFSLSFILTFNQVSSLVLPLKHL